MPVKEQRKDNKGRNLHSGEFQMPDGRYRFKYTDAKGKRRVVYSMRLTHNDPVPPGCKKTPALREMEKDIQRKLFDHVSPNGGGYTVLSLAEKYVGIRTGVRPTTVKGYGTVINLLKKDSFGRRPIYAGGFAYIVFHEGRLDVVRYNNVGGRDAILLGFGIAIMAYSFTKFILVPPYVRNLIPILMIVLGSFYFTDKYLDYQEDWINTREFSAVCETTAGMGDADTVLVDFLNYSPCDGRRSSTLNGASYLISGRKNRYFIDNSSVWASPSMISDKLSEYICDEYDPSDVTIDGVLLIDNCPISNVELVRLRFCELFCKDEFERAIESMTAAKYIPVSKKISDELYSLHEEGKLTGEELRSRW